MGDFEVIFMDAGQGDCTAILYPDGTLMLVDCGSTKSGAHAFGPIKQVLDQKFKNPTKTDLILVLTHPDEDHYNLLRNIDVESYINAGGPSFMVYGGDVELYQNARENFYTYDLVRQFKDNKLALTPNGASIEPDSLLSRAGVNVTILAANCTGNPKATSGKAKNTNSIVLLVEYKGAKIFLMGDAFIRTEEFIINAFKKAGQLSRLQKQKGEHVVLKMGHHGSTTSTSEAWVKLIEPEIIVCSSGTKLFKQKGMPSAVHLDETVSWTSLTTTDISQSYVVWDESKKGRAGKDFVVRGKTNQAIWTTCYDLEWQNNNRWFEAGQTWYYGVAEDGSKKGDHWQGYTGYEDT